MTLTTLESPATRAGVPQDLLIGATWSQAQSGACIEVRNPFSGEVIATVASGDGADIDAAVSVARDSFENRVWLDLGPAARARILWTVADRIDAEAEDLARLETANLGIPLAFARSQVANAAEAFRYYAGWCTKITGKTMDISKPGRPASAHTLKEPIGVVGMITPWNAPLLMACWKLAPALAAGCSCVLKPAEETPLTALRLGAILLAAGIPAGVVNIVPGIGHTAGATLAAHPDVDKISFTGSTEVGKLLVQAAAGNLKKLTLELGGKSPFIIFNDADLSKAIPAAVMAIYTNSGQMCAAGSRLFVQRGVYDQVVAGLKAAAEKMVVGDPMADGTQMGPVVSKKQMETVLGYIDAGRRGGARVITGGAVMDQGGFLIAPTILADVSAVNVAGREEIFGPVLTVSVFDGIDEVIRQANDSVFGLAGYVWTENGARQRYVAGRLKAGTVWVNTALLTDYAAPAGGYKQSGWGRESGLEGLEPYLETKSIITTP